MARNWSRQPRAERPAVHAERIGWVGVVAAALAGIAMSSCNISALISTRLEVCQVTDGLQNAFALNVWIGEGLSLGTAFECIWFDKIRYAACAGQVVTKRTALCVLRRAARGLSTVSSSNAASYSKAQHCSICGISIASNDGE